MTGTMLGPYRVHEKLGEGGMGEVYRARDTRLERDVAIKVLPENVAANPDRRRRFEQEARAVAALNHPHICQLYDVGPNYLVPTPRWTALARKLNLPEGNGVSVMARRRGPAPAS